MRIKDLRLSFGKKQKEVAEALNIPRSTYNSYEQGISKPSFEAYIKLADYYGVSLDYIAQRNFNNDVGYISDLEKELLQITKKLKEDDIGRVIAYATGRIDKSAEIKYENKWGVKKE